MDITFKTISEEDVNQLRDLAIKTFRQSYEHLNSPSNFNWYIKKAFPIEKLLSEIQNEESFYFFVCADDITIGYLKFNIDSSQTEAHSDNFLEIERIYLDAFHQRKGYGRNMIQFAIKKAKALQKSKIWLGVWDQNPSAIRFYKNNGFQKTGNHIFKFGDEDQIDFIMERNVSIV